MRSMEFGVWGLGFGCACAFVEFFSTLRRCTLSEVEVWGLAPLFAAVRCGHCGEWY
jgi:hypothetical protein